MGHGDEIVIADANFPAETIGKRVVKAYGIGGEPLLDAILKMMPLDTYVDENFMLMQTVGDDPIPEIWDSYSKIANDNDDNVRLGKIERFAFYERAKKAYAVIATGEEAVYANIILKKGVIK
jgi:L-fucose mutarotase